MPQELRAHLRYPEDLFRVQTNMCGRYHITDPQNFYEKTSAWAVANDPGTSVERHDRRHDPDRDRAGHRAGAADRDQAHRPLLPTAPAARVTPRSRS